MKRLQMLFSTIGRFGRTVTLCALGAATASASPIWVSNLNDSGPQSLRAAITAANSAGSGDIRFSVTGTITLLSPLPSLTGNTSITGPGTNLLTISGNNAVSIFAMNPGTSNVLSGLTIANGSEQGDFGPIDAYASGILNEGVLKLLNCVVRNCTNLDTHGVGIYNAGELEMESSVVADCGGVGWQYLNTPGGGIFNEGTLRMKKCTVSRCNAYQNAVAGGGILNLGNLELTETSIDSCRTSGMGDGGGIWSDGSAVLRNCVISNCVADFWGGAIASYGTLGMTNSTIVGNRGFQLGGGLNLGGANWVVGCTISENYCSGSGGGVFNYGGELRMLNCTVSGNSASDYWAGGGGIGQGATAYGSQTNAAVSADYCTIVSNLVSSTLGPGGGGAWNGAGPFVCQDCILANNTPTDFVGTLTSSGHNLIKNASGATLLGDLTGDTYGSDPMLGPLRNNGGPTWTHALLLGSRAIDAGGGTSIPLIDQRGVSRPQGSAPDIGAFEFRATTPILGCPHVKDCTNSSLAMWGLRGGSYTLQGSSNLVDWINISTNLAGTNGMCLFGDHRWDKATPHFYRLSVSAPPHSVYLPAPSGIVTPPLLISNSFIFHAIDTNTPLGGRAEYPFEVPETGNYVLLTAVSAPNESENSFFVNVDAEPQDPSMIWDIPITGGLALRTVSWRGGGTTSSNEFVPKVFSLDRGPHRLIIRGREAHVELQSIFVAPYP